MGSSSVGRLLREVLSTRYWAALRSRLRATREEHYETVMRRAVRGAEKLESRIGALRKLAVRKCGDLRRTAPERRPEMLRGYPPAMQLALAGQLAKESWAHRYDDLPASLELAELAVQAAFLASESGFLSAPSKADLAAETLAYLGNARRINSDLPGAEQAFAEAEAYLQRGTLDRALRAQVLMLRFYLYQAQGRAELAVEVLDHEIPLRRLLGDEEALGEALINRGWMETSVGSLERACGYVAQGVERVRSPLRMVIGLHVLGEALAREGHGRLALRTVECAEKILPLVDAPTLRSTHRWVRGLTHRALGESELAERELRAVREELLSGKMTLRAAFASLDLAGTLQNGGAAREVRELVEEAYAVFVAERLERRALSALVRLRSAIEAERASRGQVVDVANYLARQRSNRRLRFEPR